MSFDEWLRRSASEEGAISEDEAPPSILEVRLLCYKLQVLHMALACLSLCSSVRKLEKTGAGPNRA
jgi:hypothetical protein